MTVSQDYYGTSNNPMSRGPMSLERKNIPPPLPLSNFNFPSLTLQQHHHHQHHHHHHQQQQHQLHGGPHSPHNTPYPKSAPPSTSSSSNSDFMQMQLQMMINSANEPKTPGPTSLKSQFGASHPTVAPSNMMFGNGLYSSLYGNGGGALGHPTTVPSGPHQQQQQQSQQHQHQQQSPDSPQSGSDKNSANRYKTELCRPFEESGCCKYGDKCQFAHGIQELRDLSRHPKYKTEQCRTFHSIGFCPYGPRCHFIHNVEEKREHPISPGPHNPGSHAILQNLPALLVLLQQPNINKLLTNFSKMQLGGGNGGGGGGSGGDHHSQDLFQYLVGQQTLMSPPNTPNMFSFSAAAQALNQAARSTSNLHSYINFNIALKDQNFSNILNAAQLAPMTTSNHIAHQLYTHNNPTPPSLSPSSSPPLSGEFGLDVNGDSGTYSAMSNGTMAHVPTIHHASHHHQQHHHPLAHHQVYQQGTTGGGITALGYHYLRHHELKAGSGGINPEYNHLHQPPTGRQQPQETTPSSPALGPGKRLPIFNQLADPVDRSMF